MIVKKDSDDRKGDSFFRRRVKLQTERWFIFSFFFSSFDLLKRSSRGGCDSRERV